MDPKNLRPTKFWDPKIFGSKASLVQKYLGKKKVQNMFHQTKMGFNKISGPRSTTNFGQKNSARKYLGKKIVPRNIWVLPGQISPGRLASAKDGPKNLPL